MEITDVKTVELSAGTIDYIDTGAGPALVLLHGLMMDAWLWDETIAELSGGHRCVAPTLPLGAHRHAMHPKGRPVAARHCPAGRGVPRPPRPA
jgi:pimeloyl-ACP methyl ester carboxylesterase